MSKINTILSERLKKPKEKESKMQKLALRSLRGDLSSFSGVFQVSELSHHDTSILEKILSEHKSDTCNITVDLESLTKLTSEIKAITNQAVILHGQRIKQAQKLFKKYTDGAFSAWLIETYGNRQTPYNFLQYFDLHATLSLPLREKMNQMPRQAVYSLSSRKGSQKEKQKFIEEYKGENKISLLEKLSQTFPLAKKDKRGQNIAQNTIKGLRNLLFPLKKETFFPSKNEKKEINELLKEIKQTLTS